MGAKKAQLRRAPVSGAGIRYTYVWLSLILFLLTSIGIFSSRAQSLFLPNQSMSVGIERRNLFPESPVYSPLAQSVHFLSMPSSPAKPVSADSTTTLEPGFSWNGWSESQWWIPQQQEQSSEANWLSKGSLRPSRETIPYGGLFPRLQSRDIDPQAIMGKFITMGVADLLEDLGEREVDGIAGQKAPQANPFDKALKEAANESSEASGEVGAEPEKTDEQTESDSSNTASSNNEGSETEEAALGGGGASMNRNLLFIGSFDGRSLATAVGSVQPNLLLQTRNHAVVIELEDAAAQSFDLDLVLRSRLNQESAAFGDLNRDGFPDMVVTNKTTNRARLFEGDGQGNYETAGVIFGGNGPSAAVIGDFNADGSADVAVALREDRRIVVDGKGLRKFIFLPTSNVAEEFSAMVPCDFDGDGLLDLLLSNYENLTASIYLNQGKGLFAESGTFELQSFPSIQSRVDLDADGIEDIVYIQCLGDNISVVMMNGKNGTISNMGNMTLDPSLYFVLGDFNLDGFVDIALAHRR